MRSIYLRGVLLASLATIFMAGFASGAVAQDAPAQARIESLVLKDADMVAATRALTDKTGVQFLIKPSDKAFGRVTLSLGEMTVEDALKYICQAAGAYYRRDENGVYIISHDKPVEEKPAETATTAPPATHNGMYKIRLLHADPRVVYEEVLGIDPIKNGQVFDTRVWEGIKAFQEMQSRSSVISPQGGSGPTFVSQPVGNSYVAQPKTGSESGNDVRLPGEAADQAGLNSGGGFGGGQGGGFGGGRGGGGGGFGGQGGGGGLGQGGGGNVKLQGGQGYVPQGIENFTYDPTDNSFIVEGPASAVDDLRKAIELFDVAPQQLTIKVQFVSTTSDLSHEVGYDWLYSRGAVITGNTPGTFADSGNPIFLSFSSGNVSTNFRTQLLKDHGKLVNSPIIRTLNNEPAQVAEYTTTSLLIDTVVGNGAGSVITAPQLIQLQVTTQLTVAPRINNDGTITVYLAPTYSDFGAVHQLPDGTQVPDIFAQQLSVVARVKNGETIVLGGLVHKNDQTSELKYPILGDLPIIGQFFRKTNTSNSDTELLIFVTPTIIDDDSVGGQSF